MRRRVLTVLTVAIAIVGVASIAFAWFSWTQSTAGNTIASGEMTFTTAASPGMPWSISGLVPSDGTDPLKYFVAIRNDGDDSALIKAYLTGLTGDTGLKDVIKVRVFMQPSDDPWGLPDTFGAPDFQCLDPDTGVPGEWLLSELVGFYNTPLIIPESHTERLEPGEWAVYRIELWMDGSAGNAYQNKSMGFTFNWFGTQDGDTTYYVAP